MSERINYLIKALVASGPSVTINGTLMVDAYDKLDATVLANGDPLTVEVQPGSGGQILIVSASAYKDLTYEVDGEGIPLDGPLFLIGSGALGLLGDAQKQFVFTNTSTADITVSILVGRDAISTS